MHSKLPSQFVGSQVRRLRDKRGWRQEDLAARLAEIGVTGWRQSKIAKVESGQAKRITIDEVLELAAGLGCSPLWLFAPDEDHADDSEIDVRIGSNIVRPAAEIRQWVRGHALLFWYTDEREGEEAAKFYFFDSQPLSEWLRHRANQEFEGRMRQAIEAMPKWRQAALEAYDRAHESEVAADGA